MKDFKFNKIIVIESIEGEAHTGKDLYDDLIGRLTLYHENLMVDYNDVSSLLEWDALMERIEIDSRQGIIPILHFEIHGEENGNGLVLKDGELISIEHVGAQLRKININTGCNLFITLGVCKGLYLLFNMLMSEPMPFIGAVGSFENLLNGDIYIRFYDFYDTLSKTLDIGQAYVALQNANPNLESKYRYIPADEIFYKNYQEYLNKNCTDLALKSRAKEAIASVPGIINRHDRRQKERWFIKEEKRRRAAFFRKHVNTFFMLEMFPENKERFNVPSTFKELKERYEHLVLI